MIIEINYSNNRVLPFLTSILATLVPTTITYTYTDAREEINVFLFEKNAILSILSEEYSAFCEVEIIRQF